MDFRFVDDEYVWNIPLARQENAQFLQSWEWGVFQRTLGRDVKRVQVLDQGEPIAALQLVQHTLPFGKHYWYAPRGPVIFTPDEELLDTVTRAFERMLGELAATSGAVYSRFEPMGNIAMAGGVMAGLGAKSSITTQPQDELAVRTDSTEEVLLSSMHEKTRYNIRLAEKHEVNARLIEQPDYARRVFPLFWKLLEETAQRQKIRTHGKPYYHKMVDLLVPRGVLKLLIAEQNDVIVGAHLLSIFGDTVYYLHGGSSYEHRALMAPHLLHWEGIRLAKRLGKTFYNFGGASPEGAADHPWQNLTRFKEGFMTIGQTGQRFHYLGGFDLIQRPLWYRSYRTLRKLSKVIYHSRSKR